MIAANPAWRAAAIVLALSVWIPSVGTSQAASGPPGP